MRNGFNPLILSGDPTPVPTAVVTGGGTGQGGDPINASPVAFSVWIADSDLAQDIIPNGTIDVNDYAAWWEICNFTREQWIAANGEDPKWEDYFG